ATGDRVGKAKALNQLAIIYMSQASGKDAEAGMKKARDTFLETVSILKPEENVEEEGKALNNLGQIHFAMFDMATAIDCFNKTMEIVRKAGIRNNEANVHVSLGAVRFTMGDPQEAINHWTRALDLFRAEKRLYPGEAEANDNLATAYSLLGEKKRALEY